MHFTTLLTKKTLQFIFYYSILFIISLIMLRIHLLIVCMIWKMNTLETNRVMGPHMNKIQLNILGNNWFWMKNLS